MCAPIRQIETFDPRGRVVLRRLPFFWNWELIVYLGFGTWDLELAAFTARSRGLAPSSILDWDLIRYLGFGFWVLELAAFTAFRAASARSSAAINARPLSS